MLHLGEARAGIHDLEKMVLFIYNFSQNIICGVQTVLDLWWQLQVVILLTISVFGKLFISHQRIFSVLHQFLWQHLSKPRTSGLRPQQSSHFAAALHRTTTPRSSVPATLTSCAAAILTLKLYINIWFVNIIFPSIPVYYCEIL